MKKMIAMILACALLLCSAIVPAMAEYNYADAICFKAWYITVKDNGKVELEGSIVNDNNGGRVTGFRDFELVLYYNGEEIFLGQAGNFSCNVRAGSYKTVSLTFAPANCWVDLEPGRYDVRNLLTSAANFTCYYDD